MQDSKIAFSPAEMELFKNAELILTKNSIMKKLVALLSEVSHTLAGRFELGHSPKISKGENYLGLPYAILDYPRLADGHHLCFIRNMAWWGNFYSCTLHVAGRYKTQNENALLNAYNDLAKGRFYIAINSDPWQHHFSPDNYQSVAAFEKSGFEKLVRKMSYIKIAARWPLDQWSAAANNFETTSSYLFGLITKPVK